MKFIEDNVQNVPNDQAGVYSFVADAGIANHPACNYLLYIGMTQQQNFRARYKQYLREKNNPKPRIHILRMINNWSGHLFIK